MSQELRDLILSHHKSDDYDRCFTLSFRGEEYHLCSRCVGWYSSFLAFWLALFLGADFFLGYSLVILYAFPLPALADWGVHRFGVYEGTNLTRLTTGVLIGFAFATLLYRISRVPLDPQSWAVVVIYTSIAVSILTLTKAER